MRDNNLNIINNMLIHYSGLLKAGTKTFGDDFMSQSIFKHIDTNGNGELEQSEINSAKSNLTSYIEEVLEKDSFWAEIHFGEEYTKNLKSIDKNSDKTESQQIIENNLNNAVNMIFEYAASHPEDTIIQKYAVKLAEIVNNKMIKLTDIKSEGVCGQANKINGKDEILIDNTDSISNLSINYLLKTLLHELRHTLETDDINSKAEEKEAEETARTLQEKISGQKIFNNSISTFLKPYSAYAEASPGTYNIPENTGIAVWYKPVEVSMSDSNELVIKSDIQKSMNNVYIEDHIQFGNDKDENNNPLPISAKCIIKDADGNILHEYDYGDYDMNKRRFNYHMVHAQQSKLKIIPNMFGLAK